MKKLQKEIQKLYNQYQRHPSYELEDLFNRKYSALYEWTCESRREDYTLYGQQYLSLSTYLTMPTHPYVNLTFSCFKSHPLSTTYSMLWFP